MPIYEYACMSCESHFEELVRDLSAPVSCPECGGSNVRKQLSTFAVHGSGPSFGDVPSSGGGGCCGGSCGCS